MLEQLLPRFREPMPLRDLEQEILTILLQAARRFADE
jgi:hypothetical protein